MIIVAIPKEDDYVWRLSSEKVPHMTLLYIDELDADKAQHVVEHLQHIAATSLGRFGLSVEKRGPLGSDKADVLFFDRAYTDTIATARTQMLQDDVIREAFDAVEQYPEWTPHLTMGYPETPAKPDTREYPGVNWVYFDRIALWTDEYGGIDIELKPREDHAIAMSARDRVESVLAHYGVKGMRWGQTKKKSTSSSSASETSPKDPPKRTQTTLSGKMPKDKNGRIPKGQGPRLVDSTSSSETAKATVKVAPKKRTELSDEELRSRINRINMEQQYSKLTAPAPSKSAVGRKIVTDILLDVGKQQAKVVLNGIATKELAKRGIVAPKKKKAGE